MTITITEFWCGFLQGMAVATAGFIGLLVWVAKRAKPAQK